MTEHPRRPILPPPHPALLDRAERPREAPLYLGLSVLILSAFVLLAALRWLGMGH